MLDAYQRKMLFRYYIQAILRHKLVKTELL
jgi:hypothetical protein